jgi:uncharacterized membrane protein
MDKPSFDPPLTRQAYIAALKRALDGLPAELQAKTLAFYEQRFVDETGRGRSEDEIARELGDPGRIAMTLRASTHLQNVKQGHSPVSIVRVGLTAIGLALFNLFMLVPASVFLGLLFSLYVGSFMAYLGGIGMTAGGLAGVSDITILPPHRIVHVQHDGHRVHVGHGDGNSGVRISISKQTGINITGDDSVMEDMAERPASRRHGPRVRINEQLDGIEQTTQTGLGIAMIAGGIGLLLLAIVISRYTLVGLKHYVRMHVSLLRGA